MFIRNLMKGIFYNSRKATCSIWESGIMVYNCLKQSPYYQLDYSEDRIFNYSYDFVVYNHHYWVNPWITKEMVTQFTKPIYCIVTEITQGDNPMSMTPDFYTAYILLDPTIDDLPGCGRYGFPRPLEPLETPETPQTTETPVIGSFGFATDGKRWDLIVKQVNQEFDRALIRFNIPLGTYVDPSIHQQNIEQIRQSSQQYMTKPDIQLQITHDNLTKSQLIEWCRNNTVNVFFYQRDTSGLAAVIDQAVSSRRPLLVNHNHAFRHVHKYLPQYPDINLKQTIDNTQSIVAQMAQDWSQKAFMDKFNNIMRYHHHQWIRHIPFYGQNQEDAYASTFFPEFYQGVCVEVGASNGIENSNTYHFEQRGWNVLTIEPEPVAFYQCHKTRKHCINCCIASKDSDSEQQLTVYQLHNDDTSAITSLIPDPRLIQQLGHLVKSVSKIPVIVRSLTSLLQELDFPSNGRKKIDIVSIDTENTELDVLKGIDFDKYDIKMLIIENNYNQPECYNYLIPFGYVKINRICVNDFFIKMI